MSFGRKKTIFGMSAAVAGIVAIAPMSMGFAFETEDVTVAEADAELLAAGGVADLAMGAASEIEEPTVRLDETADVIVAVRNDPAPVEVEEAPAEQAAMNSARDADLMCLAKIVHHEAANQSRTGQLAVAQLVMNRVESPRFPNTICGVAHQRGQFFNTNAYSPAHDNRWNTAVEVAIDARNDVSAPVVGEAVFYHAAYAYSRFHASRPRVAQIGDHIFYR